MSLPLFSHVGLLGPGTITFDTVMDKFYVHYVMKVRKEGVQHALVFANELLKALDDFLVGMNSGQPQLNQLFMNSRGNTPVTAQSIAHEVQMAVAVSPVEGKLFILHMITQIGCVIYHAHMNHQPNLPDSRDALSDTYAAVVSRLTHTQTDLEQRQLI